MFDDASPAVYAIILGIALVLIFSVLAFYRADLAGLARALGG